MATKKIKGHEIETLKPVVTPCEDLSQFYRQTVNLIESSTLNTSGMHWMGIESVISSLPKWPVFLDLSKANREIFSEFPIDLDLLKKVSTENLSTKVDVKHIAENMSVYWLPMYLDSGKTVSVFIEKRDNEFIFTNNLYVDLEISLNKPNIMRDYVLKSSKFVTQKSEILLKNGIAVNELQVQRVIVDTYEELSDKLFHYAHFIKIFYNHIYNYMIIHSKVSEQKDILKNSVKQFLKDYCRSNKNAVKKLDSDGLLSNTNYYKTKKGTIISTANSKLRLAEMFLDFETLADRGLSKGGIVLMDISSKNHLTEDYIYKLKLKFKKYNIEPLPVIDRENLQSSAFKRLREVI
ncbi:hypothetical protein [Labilibaculum euxinus]